jgi:2-oxoglutarate ferredoxin oxidoreductase subunit beta
MKQVFDRPRTLLDARFHYCPGCHHGTIHRIVAETLDRMELRENTIGIAPVGCAVMLYDYMTRHPRAPHVAEPRRLRRLNGRFPTGSSSYSTAI